jgi:hypothetical protein
MIISEDLTIQITPPISLNRIETELKSKGLNILRWAITKVEKSTVTLRIAREKQD